MDCPFSQPCVWLTTLKCCAVCPFTNCCGMWEQLPWGESMALLVSTGRCTLNFRGLRACFRGGLCADLVPISTSGFDSEHGAPRRNRESKTVTDVLIWCFIWDLCPDDKFWSGWSWSWLRILFDFGFPQFAWSFWGLWRKGRGGSTLSTPQLAFFEFYSNFFLSWHDGKMNVATSFKNLVWVGTMV